MFKRKQRTFDAVFEVMDATEAQSWAWRELADKVGEEEASKRYPPIDVADTVAAMLPKAGNDVTRIVDALNAWQISRSERYESEGNEDRAMHVGGMYMSIGLNGLGNLFGLVPPGTPSFDPRLAAVGRERGWRP
jgi:hypothetical protein